MTAIVPGASGVPGCALKLFDVPCGMRIGALPAVTEPTVLVEPLKVPEMARAVTVTGPACRGVQVAV